MSQVNLGPLKKAYQKLVDGYTDTPNELERDGLIQRFEYTLELLWKNSKKVMATSGTQSGGSPKEIFRELANLAWIDGAQDWIEYLNKRNEASHIYNKEVAEEIFAIIPKFIKSADILIKTLEDKNS
jgi:nucleotidyltransferase substrate binding protein (TIGR01987 family)